MDDGVQTPTEYWATRDGVMTQNKVRAKSHVAKIYTRDLRPARSWLQLGFEGISQGPLQDMIMALYDMTTSHDMIIMIIPRKYKL